MLDWNSSSWSSTLAWQGVKSNGFPKKSNIFCLLNQSLRAFKFLISIGVTLSLFFIKLHLIGTWDLRIGSVLLVWRKDSWLKAVQAIEWKCFVNRWIADLHERNIFHWFKAFLEQHSEFFLTPFGSFPLPTFDSLAQGKAQFVSNLKNAKVSGLLECNIIVILCHKLYNTFHCVT